MGLRMSFWSDSPDSPHLTGLLRKLLSSLSAWTVGFFGCNWNKRCLWSRNGLSAFQIQKDIQSLRQILLAILQSLNRYVHNKFWFWFFLSMGQCPQHWFVLQTSCWTALLTDVGLAAESLFFFFLICLMRW